MRNNRSLKRFTGVNTRVFALLLILSVVAFVSTCCTGHVSTPTVEPTISATNTPSPTVVPTTTNTPMPTIVPTPVYPEISMVAWADEYNKGQLEVKFIHYIFLYTDCKYIEDILAGNLDDDWIYHYHVKPYLTFVASTASPCKLKCCSYITEGPLRDEFDNVLYDPLRVFGVYVDTLSVPLLCQISYEYHSRYGGPYVTWERLTEYYGDPNNPEVYCELFDLSKGATQPSP
jgi:hypothetical protein